MEDDASQKKNAGTQNEGECMAEDIVSERNEKPRPCMVKEQLGGQSGNMRLNIHHHSCKGKASLP